MTKEAGSSLSAFHPPFFTPLLCLCLRLRPWSQIEELRTTTTTAAAINPPIKNDRLIVVVVVLDAAVVVVVLSSSI